MYPVARGSRRQDGFHGSDNPFEMMNSQMSMLSSQMDRMMNGMIQPGGGFGGGFGGGGFESMMGGAGGGGMSYSSCSYSCSSGGPGGRTVTYSSSSHGVQRPGEDMVRESHRNYQDSSGRERIGVSRTIGNRGRSIVAERNPDGTEVRTDNVLNVADGTTFDREWSQNRTSQHVTQAHTQARTQARGLPMGSLMGGGSFHGGGAPMLRHAEPMPTQTREDREAARQGHAMYQQQREKMLADARAQRQQQERQPSNRSQPSNRGQVGPRNLTTRTPSRPMLSHFPAPKPPQQLPARPLLSLPSALSHACPPDSTQPQQLEYRQPAHSRARGGGGGDDVQYASRLAQQEARRAGLY